MDSDAILTAVNAAESMVNAPHEPERSSYRARKTVEQIIHLIFLLCGIVAVAFVLLISIYLILSGLPGLGPHEYHHRRPVRHSGLYPHLCVRHCRGDCGGRTGGADDRHVLG